MSISWMTTFRAGEVVAELSHPSECEEHLAAPDMLVWIELHEPTLAEMQQVGAQFGFHELAIEDAVKAHQRSKMDSYDHNDFITLRHAWMVPGSTPAATIPVGGELHMFVGKNFVVSVTHGNYAGAQQARQRLLADTELLASGSKAIVYAIVDQCIDDFAPVMQHLEQQVDAIEDQLFGGNPGISKRIYRLSSQVILLQRAVEPMPELTARLKEEVRHYAPNAELLHGFTDVHDHAARLSARIGSTREILQNALTLDGTLTANRMSEVSMQQSEQAKKISGWAAIFFAPTFVAGVYGMNFVDMPELNWALGYPYAIALMLVFVAVLFIIFKRKDWI